MSECAHAGVLCVFTRVAVRWWRVPPQAARSGRGRQSSGAQSPPFTEEAQEEDARAHSLTVPPAGLLRKPDHESVPPVLCQEQSVEASGIVVRIQNLEKTAPQLRETLPHPSLAFTEAVTVGFVGTSGAVWRGADVLSYSVSDSLRPHRL